MPVAGAPTTLLRFEDLYYDREKSWFEVFTNNLCVRASNDPASVLVNQVLKISYQNISKPG